MQAVKPDGHTLCKFLDSCQEDKKERRGLFIIFLPLIQNLETTDLPVYLEITISWHNRKKFKKKDQSKKNTACFML